MRVVRYTVIGLLLLVAGGWLFAEDPATNLINALRQVQDALKRLQSDVKDLQEAVKHQSEDAKKKSAKPVPQASSVSAPTAPKPSFQKAMEAYNKGRELQMQGLFRAAIDAYNESAAMDATNDAAFFRRAEAYRQLGEYANAKSSYSQSLAVQGNNSQAYFGRASVESLLGDTKAAMADVNEALLRDDKNLDSFLLRARLNELEGDPQRAVADYTMALSLVPNSEKALLGRASALLARKQYDRAMADCDSVVRMNANSSPAHMCRAEVLIQLKEPDRAVEAVYQAMVVGELTNQPSQPLLSVLGSSLENNSPRKAALQEANAPTPVATPPAPVQPPVVPPPAPAKQQPTLPIISVLNGLRPDLPPVTPSPTPRMEAPAPKVEADKTVATMPAATATAGTPATPLRSSSQFEKAARERIDKENFQEALAMLDQALQMKKSAKTFNARGYVHLRMRNYQPAISDFTDAIRLNAAYANAYHNRAVARRAVGQIQEAKLDDREAEKLSGTAPLTASR